MIAVGNPFGLGGTVTAGIVSARGRDIGAGPYDDFLQIDAPVNHGNSGGPTFNANGEVVGVNTAIFSPSGGSVGIGFAIAGDVAKSVVQPLKDDGKVVRGWLGVQIQPVTQDIADSLGLKEAKGAIVAKVEKGSPAAAAGLQDGDVIAAVNGQAVADAHDLARTIATLGPKNAGQASIIRKGSTADGQSDAWNPPGRQAGQGRRSPDAPAKDAMTKYGMTLAPATAVDVAGKTGVVVANVDPDGPRPHKGIQTGDVILEVAGKPVSQPSDVRRRSTPPRPAARSPCCCGSERGQPALRGAVDPGRLVIREAGLAGRGGARQTQRQAGSRRRPAAHSTALCVGGMVKI